MKVKCIYCDGEDLTHLLGNTYLCNYCKKTFNIPEPIPQIVEKGEKIIMGESYRQRMMGQIISDKPEPERKSAEEKNLIKTLADSFGCVDIVDLRHQLSAQDIDKISNAMMNYASQKVGETIPAFLESFRAKVIGEIEGLRDLCTGEYAYSMFEDAIDFIKKA